MNVRRRRALAETASAVSGQGHESRRRRAMIGMARVLAVAAALLWAAGVAVLVIGVLSLHEPRVRPIRPSPVKPGAIDLHLVLSKPTSDPTPKILLTVGTVLVGVSGLAAASGVLAGRGRR